MNSVKKSLIVTLPPEIWGGVGSMAKIFANYLCEKGFEVTIAYYSTHGYRPRLNVSIREFPLMLRPDIQKEIVNNFIIFVLDRNSGS